MRLYEEGKWTDAQTLFDHFEADSSTEAKLLREWSRVYRGESLANAHKREAALAAYRSVSPSSAASLDARVAVLFLDQGTPEFLTVMNTPHAILSNFETTLEKARRTDLLAQVAALRLEVFLKSSHSVLTNDDLLRSLPLWQRVVQSTIPTPVLNEVQKLSYSFFKTHEKNFLKLPTAEFLAFVRIGRSPGVVS